MKAIVYTEYGPPHVLRLKDIEKPAPADNEVLVKIHAASLNAADWHLMRAEPFIARLYSGLLKPTKFPILGADIAGHVEAVGKKISRFQPKDEVFGDISASGFGGFAEYACAYKIKPVIDRCYPLNEVPEAVRYLEIGHAQGKVVIRNCSGKAFFRKDSINRNPLV